MTDSPSGAIISDDQVFRYALWRRWNHDPLMVFVMLNPSTADASQDDPTIRRCIGFAQREWWGGILVVNLFAFRSSSPALMKKAPNPVGPENNTHIRTLLAQPHGPVVCAWGSHGSFQGRDQSARSLLGPGLKCLGKTNAGQPKHPLYLPKDAELIPWP